MFPISEKQCEFCNHFDKSNDFSEEINFDIHTSMGLNVGTTKTAKKSLSSTSSESTTLSPAIEDAAIIHGKIIFVSSEKIDSKDILFGNDRLSFKRCGNKRFRAIIDTYRERYQNTKFKEDKAKIIIEIVRDINQNGYRFLKRNEGEENIWYVVNDQCAHEKVIHALRSYKEQKRKIHPRKKKQTTKTTPSDDDLLYFRKLLKFQEMVFQKYVEQISD